MPRVLGKLSQRRIATAKPKRGRRALMLADGGNLYLQCTLAGDGTTVRRSWVFRYEIDHKRHEVGLGPSHTISLSQARDRARALRVQLVDNIDPLAAREATRREKLAEAARTKTFKEVAEMYLASSNADGWGAAHRHQWIASLQTYVYPKIGALSVADIDQPAVLSLVEPIWREKTTTASRVRARIEKILDYATTYKFRSGDNPARILTALGKPSKIAKTKHFAALSWEEMPNFMAQLRGLKTTVARCLEFLIYTSTRSNEAIGARWDEINFKTKTWTIPASRMKEEVEHRVPLSTHALELLGNLPRNGPLVFGDDDGKIMQDHALRRQALAKLRPGASKLTSSVTTHGFRASFKTWCGECTNFASETAELALAHKVGNKVEQAYEKGDKLAKRARLMQAWADFLAKPAKAAAGTVVPMKAQA